ncbi:MarR family transcriptional regulator [Dactylosporangium sp. NPDC005572]|uniref:MarR family winged helix-turn-helix transcriptional regulator n=1 Tax=Dactylosporangium sp. NPDC005572 TaxID=3156889 RepID=UPI0033B86A92
MEDHRLHEVFMGLVRLVSAWHFDTPGGLSLSQAAALHTLDTEPPLSQQELADRLGLEKSSVSRLVGDLERRGLLERRRDADNRRLNQLRLTDAGRAAHHGLAGSFHGQFEQWSAGLTAEERDALVRGLSALLRVARDDH